MSVSEQKPKLARKTADNYCNPAAVALGDYVLIDGGEEILNPNNNGTLLEGLREYLPL